MENANLLWEGGAEHAKCITTRRRRQAYLAFLEATAARCDAAALDEAGEVMLTPPCLFYMDNH
jgi:hypothetical protein